MPRHHLTTLRATYACARPALSRNSDSTTRGKPPREGEASRRATGPSKLREACVGAPAPRQKPPRPERFRRAQRCGTLQADRRGPGCPRCPNVSCPESPGAREARSPGADTSGARDPAGSARPGRRRCHIHSLAASCPPPSPAAPGPVTPPPAAEAEPARRSAQAQRAPQPAPPEPPAPLGLARRLGGYPVPSRAPAPPRPRGYLAAPPRPARNQRLPRSCSGRRDASRSLRCGVRPAPGPPSPPIG